MCLSIYIDKLYISPLLRDSCPFNHNVTVVCQNTSEFCYQTNGLVMVRTVWTLWNSTRTKFLSLCFSWLKQRRHFGFSLVPAVAEALVWAFLHSVKKHAIVNLFYFLFFDQFENLFQCVWVCVCVWMHVWLKTNELILMKGASPRRCMLQYAIPALTLRLSKL